MPAELATLERQLHLYKGLVEVSGLINGITDNTTLLPAVLDVARRVFEAVAASLFLINAAGELELAASRGGPTSFTGRFIVPRGSGISGWVAEHGEPLLVPDAYQDERFFSAFDKQTGFRTRSVICVPLIHETKKIGVIQMLNPVDRESFDENDLEAFAAYGTLAATAIDKLHTIERQREQQRVEHEFAWAREIQVSFLPQSLPTRPELQVAAAYRPALNVGGDFYDVIETGPGELYFVIGDVSGKGVPAALLMAQAVSTLRMIIQPGVAPGAALARWNSMLCGHTVRGMFITALLGRAVVAEHRLELVNAGHCAPYLSRADGTFTEVEMPGSPPLGILPYLRDHTHQLTLLQGEWITFFTDGLVDSCDPARRRLGRSGLTTLLSRRFGSAAELVQVLSQGEQAHRGHAEAQDDLTLLTLGFQ